MVRSNLRRHMLSTCAILAALEIIGVAEQAAAQSAGPEAGRSSTSGPLATSQLSEVVVTAERRQSTALSTPIDISALTGDDLSREGITDFHDLTRLVPGLVYNSDSIRDGGASNSFILHGLNLDEVSESGDTPLPTVAPVSVYIDETPTFINLHLADVQRIEVLRGPQASLYGDASIAGTVRVLFNQPDLSHNSAEISGSLSGTDHANSPNYSIDTVFNQPITNDIGFRVATGYTFENGFISAPHLIELDNQSKPVLATPGDIIHSLPVSYSTNDFDNSDLAYFRPMLMYRKDKLKVLITYLHQYEHSDGPDVDSYPGGPAPTSYSTAGDPNASLPFQNNGFDASFPSTFKKYQTGDFLQQPLTRNVDLGSVEASYDLGFATFTAVTSGYEDVSHATDDSSGFYQQSLGFFYEGYPRLTLRSHRDYKDYAFVEEDRLVSKSDGPLTYSVGFFYMNQRTVLLQQDYLGGFSDYEAATGTFDTGTDLGYVYDRHIHFQDLAGFGELTYHVTPKWQITGGVRVFKQTLDLLAINELPICGFYCSTDQVNPLGLAGGGDQEITKKALMKANTSYSFAPHLLGYFTYSQGERRGGANGVPQKGPFAESPQFLFFHPDTVDNYELGLKGRFFGRLELSSAGYYIDWHNPQVNVSTPNGSFPAAVNGKGARSYGIDFESRYKLTNEITLSATYGWNRAELTAPIVVGGVTYGSSGTILPGTPEHTTSLGADYQRPIVYGLNFTAHSDVSWRSGVTTSLTPAENVDLPNFAILNLSFGVSKNSWRAALFADNVTDARGVLSANNPDRYDVRALDNRLTRPLTAGIRLSYKYD